MKIIYLVAMFTCLISCTDRTEDYQRDIRMSHFRQTFALSNLIIDFKKNENRLPVDIDELKKRYQEGVLKDSGAPFVFILNDGTPKNWLFTGEQRTLKDSIVEAPDVYELRGKVFRYYLDQNFETRNIEVKTRN